MVSGPVMRLRLLFRQANRSGKAKLFLEWAAIILGALFIVLILRQLTTRAPVSFDLDSIRGSFWKRHPPAFNTEFVDWHDHAQIEADLKRVGEGEQGQASSKVDGPEKDALYKANGFNGYASDQIALDRSLKDIRHPKCQSKLYRKYLPTVSVIVPFHNEHKSTLLRTAASVWNRAPKGHVKEIILVDDGSTKEFSKNWLDNYMAETYPGVGRVIHLDERYGLITARLEGAKVATADVLLFLDSHVEANINYLPPLLDPIAADIRTVVCPFIDVIDFENFQYRAQDEGARGAFDWEFYYKRLPLLPRDKENMPEPFESPVMAGGLFAISREFFWELGGYDPGLMIWGAEQYELSFKIWQCGGRMVDAPCSRIGHIYRKFAPFPNPGKGDFVGRNHKRVMEVWMDDYSRFVYKRKPHWRKIDTGNLTAQRAVRERLHCKSFRWFMENVAFDLPRHYPMVEPENFLEGEIRSELSPAVCVDTKNRGHNERIQIDRCLKDDPEVGGMQQFAFSWHKDIRVKGKTLCFDVSAYNTKAPVLLYNCHGQKGNQYWRYDKAKRRVLHGQYEKDCLDHNPSTKELFVAPCSDAPTQRWMVEHINQAFIDKYWENPEKVLDDMAQKAAEGVLS